jgi:hypothetical protein
MLFWIAQEQELWQSLPARRVLCEACRLDVCFVKLAGWTRSIRLDALDPAGRARSGWMHLIPQNLGSGWTCLIRQEPGRDLGSGWRFSIWLDAAGPLALLHLGLGGRCCTWGLEGAAASAWQALLLLLRLGRRCCCFYALAGAVAGGSIEDAAPAGCWDDQGDRSATGTAACRGDRGDRSVRRTATGDRSGGRTRRRKRSWSFLNIESLRQSGAY